MILHTPQALFVLRFFYKKEKGLRVVMCNLSPLKNSKEKIISTGKAVCDSRDLFIKSVGRKVALHKMLNNISSEEAQVYKIDKNAIIESYKSQVKEYEDVKIPAL